MILIIIRFFLTQYKYQVKYHVNHRAFQVKINLKHFYLIIFYINNLGKVHLNERYYKLIDLITYQQIRI
jgi:hypothetical protein